MDRELQHWDCAFVIHELRLKDTEMNKEYSSV